MYTEAAVLYQTNEALHKVSLLGGVTTRISSALHAAPV